MNTPGMTAMKSRREFYYIEVYRSVCLTLIGNNNKPTKTDWMAANNRHLFNE